MSVSEQVRPLRSDERIQFGPLLLLLRRHRVFLALAALAGGVLGFGIARLTPARYVGTARLALTVPANSAAAGDVVARFRTALADPRVIQAAVSKEETRGVVVDDVLGRVTSRTSGNELTVDVSWSDPDTAAALAGSVADMVLMNMREQGRIDRELSLVYQKAELAEANRVLNEARNALVQFQQNSRLTEMRAATAKFKEASEQLASLAADIAAQRARIVTLRSGLMQLGPEDARPAAAERVGPPSQSTALRDLRADWTLAELIALNEGDLASLEARRNFVARLVDEKTREQLLREITPLQLVEAELTGEYSRALSARNVLADAYKPNAPNLTFGLDRKSDQVTAQRADRITARSASILGGGAAFVVAMFALIALDARKRPSPSTTHSGRLS